MDSNGRCFAIGLSNDENKTAVTALVAVGIISGCLVFLGCLLLFGL